MDSFIFVIEMFLISLLGVGLPAAGVATYITTVPCRFLVARRRQPGGHIAVLVALLVGVVAVLLLGGADVFHPSRWDTGKVPMWMMAPVWFAAASVGAIVPAWCVVLHYRGKLKHAKSGF